MSPPPAARYPVTPDGRYFVVRGRLWRCSNPALPPERREALVAALMHARQQKRLALACHDDLLRREARSAVDRAKRALGERGEAWWTDGAPDWNRHMVHNSPYADWFSALPSGLEAFFGE